MISCEVFRRHVDTVVDGEVDADTQIEFDGHLATCGPCRVHLSFAQSFKRQVKEACGTDVSPPPDFAARIRRALDAEDAGRAGRMGVPTAAVHVPPNSAPVDPAARPLGLAGVKLLPVKARYAVPAAAAAVALAVLAAREGGNPVEGSEPAVEATVANTVATSIFEDVVRRHASEHPAEVSGPPTHVARWFRGKLEFPVRPVEFASSDVQLVGARISNIRDREAAAFFYTVNGRRVTVMVFERPESVTQVAQRTNVLGRGIYFGRAHGHTVPLVEHEGLTYAFAGDLDSRSLLRLAARARVQPR